MNREAKVGFFVILACAVMAYFILNTSKEGNPLLFWKPTPEHQVFHAFFDDASGIRQESPVLVSGVQVGKVHLIELEQGKARVTLMLDPNLEVPEDSTIMLKSRGVLGDKYVAIEFGQGKAMVSGQTLKTEGAATLDEIMNTVDELGKSILRITTKFEQGLESGPDGNRFQAIAENLERLSAELLAAVQENRQSIRGITQNIDHLSGRMKDDLPLLVAQVKEMVTDMKEILQREQGKISTTLANAETMSAKMDQAMGSIQSITGKIDDGQGTIGKLINDNETAKKLDTILDQASESLEKVQTYLASADAFEINLEFDSSWLVEHSSMLNRFKFQISPNENKYYQVDITSGDRDYLPLDYSDTYTDLYDSEGNFIGYEHQRKPKNDKDFFLGLQFAYRWDRYFLRGGIIEETGGAGLDALFFEDKFKISGEFFDFDRSEDLNPHGRLDLTFRLPKGLRLKLGWDDFLESDYQSIYIGAGIRWQDKDLKPLLGSMARAL